MEVHAILKFSQCAGFGIHSGGHAYISALDFSAVEIIQNKGIKTIAEMVINTT